MIYFLNYFEMRRFSNDSVKITESLLFTEISEQQRITATIKKEPITEFYTTKEVLAKFGISNSWLFKAAKENNFCHLLNVGTKITKMLSLSLF